MEVEELLRLVASTYGKEKWLIKWKEREENLNRTIKQSMDQEFHDLCFVGEWEKAEELLKKGASNDYVNENGVSGMILILSSNNEKLKAQVLQKYPNEDVKAISILRIVQIQILE